MPASSNKAILLAATCVVLAACGGGGGESGSAPVTVSEPVGVTPPPATSPPPQSDPPVTNLLPTAPFGLTASANFPLVGWQEISQGGGPPLLALAEQKASLGWSANLKTYSLTLADLGTGRLVQSFASNPVAFSIVQPDGGVVSAYVTVRPRTASVGDLYWQTADKIEPFVYGRAIFGLPLSGSLPGSGRRVFTRNGDPDAAIVFDFGTRKVSGTVTAYNDGGGWFPEGPQEKASIEPADIQPDGSFTAVISVPGAPTKGELRGRLFGPSGDELAVYWNAPVRDGYDKTFGDWRAVMNYVVCPTCTG